MSDDNISILNEQITKLLSKRNLSFKKLKSLLSISIKEQELENILKEMEINGSIYLNSNDEYQLFSKCADLSIGEVKLNCKNKVYVNVGRKNIFIQKQYLNGAIAGDIVIIRRYKEKNNGQNIGVIEKILRRQNGNLIFDYINDKFEVYNWPINIPISIPNFEKKKIVNGSRVLVNLKLDKTNNDFNGNIVSLIGHKDDPKLDVKTIVSNNGVLIDFTDKSLKQADGINSYVSKQEINDRLNNGGIDFRSDTVFTIDGANTKDMDDAVSIKVLANGNYLLGVHIADVSHYIKENSPLDLEARQRSTSIYPYNYAIHMLPHSLSQGICSLNPHVDRLTLSCLMEIDQEGKIVNYRIVDGIINSCMKMEYEKINDIFENNIMHKEYQPYLNDLQTMIELSNILDCQKQKRGYMNFGDDDVEFTDQNGIAINVRRKTRGLSQRLIENFMLLANETVSSFYYWLGIPGIYRDHPIPNVDSIKEIISMIGLNIPVPKNLDNAKTLQNIINKIQKYDEGEIYTQLLLQSMKRAYYSPNNIGHFGLALKNYTHFTSPIRRYPDLETHRIIRKIRDDIMNIDTDELYNKLDIICQHASTQERVADKVEREVNRYKMIEYMEQHIGEYFDGYINYISRSGVSVRTENGIYGRISIDSLKNLNFILNSEHKRLDNPDSNITLYIGDRVNILLKDANKEKGNIDFSFVEKIPKEHQKIKQLKQNRYLV